ncbi:tyrosine-type recombinase/integrase [Rubrivivax sp. JA1055]|uniref:tyrosine-type recombinase/integrase n=1 Tax=Rubrivivax sp. JA1029 TaxID=2894193 RepID=UPI001E63D705|nr:site-specific integrase [Rubrivivax sp. JA1029]MCC9598301.1 tyrosine-type recombinase/integrase [Rubrivivax sp. JA1055]MCC9645443.1 tyrosine-type recombinase/integrase [Rubrivivax sp. JA1029]
MTGTEKSITDRTLRAWLAAGPTNKSIGDGLTFIASDASAGVGKASWILRYRIGGRQREKVLGRYPDLSLKDARELARRDRAQVQQGVDIAAAKQDVKARLADARDVRELGKLWHARHIAERYKHPKVVERILERHVYPVIGTVQIVDLREHHIDQVLTLTVKRGAPTIANDALRILFRMFHFAMKRQWMDRNPAASFDLSDAGGTERPRERWLSTAELQALAKAMRNTPSFGRINELSVWLLLALCVRKMELLGACWDDFDLEAGVWLLRPERTKTGARIEIPLTEPVLAWLNEVRVLACGSDHLFPPRRRVGIRPDTGQRNRFPHVSPDTLNLALRRLELDGVEHFTVHDMRRTARSHMAALGVDRFVAERSLNHKLRDVEGTYNRYDYFDERRRALGVWAEMLRKLAAGEIEESQTSPRSRFRASDLADGGAEAKG